MNTVADVPVVQVVLAIPVVVNDRCARLRLCRKTIEFLQLLFFKFVDIPFVPKTQILMVQTFQQTTEFPQLQYFPGGRCPC